MSLDFIRESNRIEGIYRDPTSAEIAEFERFMHRPVITVDDMVNFVSVYQPTAILRNKRGLDVRVGAYLPPRGGKEILSQLEAILDKANARGGSQQAYEVHHLYESLHPFTDGNGRSGRMLWKWMMHYTPRRFLHEWYYQSLQYGGNR